MGSYFILARYCRTGRFLIVNTMQMKELAAEATSSLDESKRMGGVSIISGTHKGASGAISDLDCFW